MNTEFPEVIDLFSGCGGLSLGFQSEGFQITHGIELMDSAAQTASYNLHWRFGEESDHICADITKCSPDMWKDKIGPNGCIVIGGPPCQAYSRIGKAKLASLGEDRMDINDSRGYLFEDYLRFVYGLNAKIAIMENVPESTNYGGMNVPQKVCDSFRRNGYRAKWTILNSADFGVPQVRERVIVIAVRNDLNYKISFPKPVFRSIEDRKAAVSRLSSFRSERSFVMPLMPEEDAPHWRTVKDAFSDLPVLFPSTESRYHLDMITSERPYSSAPQNEFQKQMRGWYGDNQSAVNGNCFRKTVRDFPIFARMKQGDNYLDALKIADGLLREACAEQKIHSISDPRYQKLKKKIVPPYSEDKFIDKWQKLRLDKPSYTLVAHLSVDTYSHIHPVEPRGISVREAARLQSFPDEFLFQCTMGDAYKQIGNAVPPLLAKAVAREVRKGLTSEEDYGNCR